MKCPTAAAMLAGGPAALIALSALSAVAGGGAFATLTGYPAQDIAGRHAANSEFFRGHIA